MSSPDRDQPIAHGDKPNHLIPLVVILGPTAVGKSNIAISLAERLNGEIVSADSRLFYRSMDIGTDKPTSRDLLRVPHHLIDVSDPDEVWNLALFQREAVKAIESIYAKKRLPFLVGGTGQFIRAIYEGWSIPKVKPSHNLRRVLEIWSQQIGATGLHARLAVLDGPAAAGIEPTNVRRTIRALEVILSTGKRFSDQKQRGDRLYKSLLLGLTRPRNELYARIDDRINQMVNSGFIDEVRRLLESGYSPDLPTMSAIGYGEIVAYLHEEISLDEAIRLMKQRTRVYVRRQANWFKENDPDIHWFRVHENTVDEMANTIQNWLLSINQG